MLRVSARVALIVLALAGCSQSSEDVGNGTMSDNAVLANDSGNLIAIPGTTDSPIPADTSTRGALKVAKDYAKAITGEDRNTAASYWTSAEAAAQFATDLDEYPHVVISPGSPGQIERSGGAETVRVPMILDLTLRSGSPYQMRCKALMKRSAASGSAESENAWHIQSINC